MIVVQILIVVDRADDHAWKDELCCNSSRS